MSVAQPVSPLSINQTAMSPLSIVQPTVSPLSIIQTAAAYTPSLEELTQSYKENFYGTLIKFVIITIIQVVIVIWTLAGGGLADIATNWPKYRCNPLIMPFAALFGHDSTENFNFCMKNIFTLNAGAVLAPIYGVMSNFTDIVGTISNVANSFRYLIANLLHGMERLMGSFRDRFQFILFSVRMSFLKIMNLMGRLYSTFYAVIFMGMSGLQAAKNVGNNDMVKFLLEFCFDPETPIELESGAIIPMSALKIGNRLAKVDGKSPVVTSLFSFDGLQTPMVRIGSTVVSSQHFMYNEKLGCWIEAGQHPDAVVVNSLNKLVCLNTSTHILLINGLLFSDYDESESPEVIKETQGLAEATLNSGLKGVDIKNYDLGIEGSTKIKMADGSSKSIETIVVGDKILGGGRVSGTIKEQVTSFARLFDGTKVSPAQLIWSASTNSWVRAGTIFKTFNTQDTFYQVICEHAIFESEFNVFRDYREVLIPEMEDAYSAKFASKA